jgi:hypothetical protein
MKRLFVNIVLFFVAVFLLSTVGVFGLIYGLYDSIKNYTKVQFIQYWADIIYLINIGIDQIGNVLLSPFLNKFCLIKDKGATKFGRITETISYVLAVNYFTNNLTPFGLWLVNILEYIDKNHMEKSL